jgi:hypothetical protein
MVLNLKSWELVKDGSFIVGDRALFDKGVLYQPGEDFPNDHGSALYSMYEMNQIQEKPAKKKSKRKN